MADLFALLETGPDGAIKRIVRTYESHRRAEEDQTLLDEAADGAEKRYTISPVEHIEH